MARLTADRLEGIWAGIPMSWDEELRFDEESYRRNIRRYIDRKVHGVYTTGSTGEFYALTLEEFRRMVDIQAELCGAAGMPLQIGCNADSTAKTLRLIEHAAGREEVGAVQVALPYWMRLTDREVLQFFRDIHAAFPDMPLVHYNVPRAKRFLTGRDYLAIQEAAPSLIGVKYTFAGDNFGDLQEAMRMTPKLSYFVIEHFLASAMMIGARGSYSAVVATNPRYVLDFYTAARAGRWEEAARMQRCVSEFIHTAKAFIQGRGEGLMDPVFDKGSAVACGAVYGHQRCRPPYIGWSDDTVKAFRELVAEGFPEFLYREE